MIPRSSELLGHLFSIGMDAMVSTVNAQTGAITYQLGDAVGATYVDTDFAELWGTIGLTSRAAAPTPGAASCQNIALRHSAHDMILAQRDLRAAPINTDLQPGESCLHGTTPACNANNGRVVVRTDGSCDARCANFTFKTPGGSIAINAAGDVSLGPSATDGVVLQTLLATQLGFLATALGAVVSALQNIAGGPGALTGAAAQHPLNAAAATAVAAFTTSLTSPNYSATCKASH
jgi:hypothetical protein